MSNTSHAAIVPCYGCLEATDDDGYPVLTPATRVCEVHAEPTCEVCEEIALDNQDILRLSTTREPITMF